MDLKRIDLAIKLLNEVETKGSLNLNNLLGAIQLLEGFKKEMTQEPLETFNTGE